MAIEQNMDGARRIVVAGLPIFYLKICGTNPWLVRSGLDGAERFLDKAAMQRPVQP
jgi:hypothetical protein